MFEDEPILFFDKLTEPGTYSIFATLQDIKDLKAKNKKAYLRLVLTDPYEKTLLVQIWSDHEIYAPKEIFMKKYLLQKGGVIHLIDLSFDGDFVSSSLETKLNPIPTQHSIYSRYIRLNNYRLYKIIPEDPKIFKEIHKLIGSSKLIESIINKLQDEGVTVSDELVWAVTKLVCDKTYTGTIHLILDQPQLKITQQYTNYVLKQLDMLMIAFEQDLANNKYAPIIVINRLGKDLISLYDYTQKEKKNENIQ
jgi:hypothetical protein